MSLRLKQAHISNLMVNMANLSYFILSDKCPFLGREGGGGGGPRMTVTRDKAT